MGRFQRGAEALQNTMHCLDLLRPETSNQAVARGGGDAVGLRRLAAGISQSHMPNAPVVGRVATCHQAGTLQQIKMADQRRASNVSAFGQILLVHWRGVIRCLRQQDHWHIACLTELAAEL